MILCVCHGVRCNLVKAAIANGARDVDAVGDACRAGTDCGSCRGMIEDLIEEAMDEDVGGCVAHASSRSDRVHLPMQGA